MGCTPPPVMCSLSLEGLEGKAQGVGGRIWSFGWLGGVGMGESAHLFLDAQVPGRPTLTRLKEG